MVPISSVRLGLLRLHFGSVDIIIPSNNGHNNSTFSERGGLIRQSLAANMGTGFSLLVRWYALLGITC